MRWRNATVYGFVLAAALWLNANAFAQSVPTFEDGQWVLPAPESVGMGPDPVAAQYGSGVEQWRGVATDACAIYGCSPDYILSVMQCESGGDPNAVGPNGELGLMQIDPAYWGTYSPEGSIYFAAQHLTAGDIYWACA